MRGKKTLITGLALFVLVALLMTAFGCGGSLVREDSFIIAHQQEAPSFDEGRLKENPARVGVAITQIVDLSISGGEDMPTEGTMHDLTVKVNQVLRGEDAWKKLSAYPNNKPAPEGYEYVLANLTISLKGVASSTRWFDHMELLVDASKFPAFSSDFRKYDYVSNASLPLNELMFGSLDTGDTKTGWVLAQVEKSDPAPLLEYLCPGVPMWFKLYK